MVTAALDPAHRASSIGSGRSRCYTCRCMHHRSLFSALGWRTVRRRQQELYVLEAIDRLSAPDCCFQSGRVLAGSTHNLRGTADTWLGHTHEHTWTKAGSGGTPANSGGKVRTGTWPGGAPVHTGRNSLWMRSFIYISFNGRWTRHSCYARSSGEGRTWRGALAGSRWHRHTCVLAATNMQCWQAHNSAVQQHAAGFPQAGIQRPATFAHCECACTVVQAML